MADVREGRRKTKTGTHKINLERLSRKRERPSEQERQSAGCGAREWRQTAVSLHCVAQTLPLSYPSKPGEEREESISTI